MPASYGLKVGAGYGMRQKPQSTKKVTGTPLNTPGIPRAQRFLSQSPSV
jgi:hypothetical protein